MSSEIALKVLEILAWPLCVAVIAFVALRLFRTPLDNLLGRLRNVGFGAIQLEAELPQQAPVSSPQPLGAQGSVDDQLSKIVTMSKSYETASAVAKSLKGDMSAAGYPVSTRTEEILIHMVALATMQRNFEMAYGTIYGSQIVLMRGLIEQPSGYDQEWFSKFFAGVKERAAPHLASTSEDAYLGYLTSQNLVAFGSGRITLTKTGQEFLRWMGEQRRPSSRPH